MDVNMAGYSDAVGYQSAEESVSANDDVAMATETREDGDGVLEKEREERVESAKPHHVTSTVDGSVGYLEIVDIDLSQRTTNDGDDGETAVLTSSPAKEITGEENSTVGDVTASGEAVPRANNVPSSANNVTPSGNNLTSSANNVMPSGNNLTSSADDVMPSGNNFTSSADDLALSEKNMLSVVTNTVQDGESVANQIQRPAPSTPSSLLESTKTTTVDSNNVHHTDPANQHAIDFNKLHAPVPPTTTAATKPIQIVPTDFNPGLLPPVNIFESPPKSEPLIPSAQLYHSKPQVTAHSDTHGNVVRHNTLQSAGISFPNLQQQVMSFDHDPTMAVPYDNPFRYHSPVIPGGGGGGGHAPVLYPPSFHNAHTAARNFAPPLPPYPGAVPFQYNHQPTSHNVHHQHHSGGGVVNNSTNSSLPNPINVQQQPPPPQTRVCLGDNIQGFEVSSHKDSAPMNWNNVNNRM